MSHEVHTAFWYQARLLLNWKPSTPVELSRQYLYGPLALGMVRSMST